MAKSLVVVESPAKAKTINKYLGRDYKVIASMGHIRDLPKSKLGVDVDDDFDEEYVSLESRKKVLKELKDAAKDASNIYVATDPDREGEAIGWHLIQELKGKKRKFHRLTFNEITKKAVQEALNHPRSIDEKMVDAQRARRVLDRLVGYKISPLLWDKVRRGLSAGRVQSVALKLICDREREIEQFVPVEYWHVFARLAGPQPPEFEAKLFKKSGETITVVERGRVEGRARRPRTRPVDRLVGRHQGAQAQPRAAVHHEQAAADRAVSRQEDDDAGAAAVRGRHRDSRPDRRPHHLHANRLGARGGRGARRGARAHQDGVRRRLPAREAQRLQDQGGRPGRARGDSADVAAARPGNGAGRT